MYVWCTLAAQLRNVAAVATVPNSLLFLGRPGVGKTTVIREMARVLSDELHKRVVIVDTSNEIGGDGDVPHPAIGGARRMQVPDPSQQHKVMVALMQFLASLWLHIYAVLASSVEHNQLVIVKGARVSIPLKRHQ